MAKYKVEMTRWGVTETRYYDIYNVARDIFDALVKYAKWTHDYPIILKLVRVDSIDKEPIALLGVYRYEGVEII